MVSVGEFRDSRENVLFPCDLVVGLRDGHLYLAEAASGQHLELIVPTALNFTWGNFTRRWPGSSPRSAAPPSRR